MKELSIEDKAKRYDEAIEFAHNKHRFSSNLSEIKLIEELFHELKENEDDRIINNIKKAVESYWSDEPLHEILDWLEKQFTPQVRTGLEWVNTIDDACDKRYAEEYAHGEYCHEQSFKWGFQEGVDWLEKQGEKKPADKPLDIEIPFGTDSEIIEETIAIPEGCYAVVEGNKIIIRKGEKPADWSEEDINLKKLREE